MNFIETDIAGAYLIEPSPHRDERGYFARTWSRDAFRARGLETELSECSLSFNPKRGTLRGMHYQVRPHTEAKVVMCTRGALFDAIVDLREDSPTYRRWYGVELSASNARLLYVPPEVAHGFLTLRDDTCVHYQIAGGFEPGSARGVRWDDPAFGIEWPAAPVLMSERDRHYEDYRR